MELPPIVTAFFRKREDDPAWPGPRGRLLAGSLQEAWNDPLRLFLEGRAEHGDYVRFRFGPLDYHLVSDPAGIHRVIVENHRNYEKSVNYAGLKLVLGSGLVTSEGELWRRQRRLVQPAFHRESLAAFVEIFARCTDELSRRWAERAERGAFRANLHEEMMALTFRIVGLSLLSVDLGGTAREVGEAIEVGLRWANEYVESVLRIPPEVPLPKNLAFRRAQRTIESTLARVVEDRRRSPGPRGDLLSMLMAATDEAGGMSDRQLMDEILTLVLAGHETTANALTFAFRLLSLHPHVLRAVRDEADSVLGERAPALADLPRMPYAKAVIDEALRLYPPAWVFERQSLGPDELVSTASGGGTGRVARRLPANAVVGVSPFVMHRHPRYWDNPEGFEPERFLRPDPGRPKLAYLPFGAGPRICVGGAFATMEMQIILPMLARRFDVMVEPTARFELEPGVTLRPKGGLPVRIRARELPPPGAELSRPAARAVA